MGEYSDSVNITYDAKVCMTESIIYIGSMNKTNFGIKHVRTVTHIFSNLIVPETVPSTAITKITCNSLTINWTITELFVGQLPHTGYILEYHSRHNSKLVPLQANETGYEIMHLTPNTEYAICISANNSIGQGNCITRTNSTVSRGT